MLAVMQRGGLCDDCNLLFRSDGEELHLIGQARAREGLVAVNLFIPFLHRFCGLSLRVPAQRTVHPSKLIRLPALQLVVVKLATRIQDPRCC